MAKKAPPDGKLDDVLQEAQDHFRICEEREADNRREALDDLRFSRLAEQWPAEIRKKRQDEGRPCLTINRLPAFIRQVVNDSRQNKPQIVVHPTDSAADPQTAQVLNGLIRNIEATSKADVAYDTAVDFAVTMGFGYFRINTYYAFDDQFDLDLCIDRVANPFTIWGDPYSTSADSSDWNLAFVAELMTQDAFETKYKGAEPVDWEGGTYADVKTPWREGDMVQVAEYWTREEVDRVILMLSNQEVVGADVYQARKLEFDALGLTVAGQRTTKSHKVRQRIITGAEVLEERAWPGRYIPLVPVYGEEVNVEGKRHLRSLIRDAKDPQRMFNYWRTTSTELVALAPKAPFIGPKGAFTTDAAKWATANTDSHAFIEYDGVMPPQRQPFSGVPAGALQEAMSASDDLKTTMGLFDASMGAQGNETSGRAILARQREGDVSTFHFIDNLARAIEHGGRILLDLIPIVYSGKRVIRVLGPEGQRLQGVQIGPSGPPAGAAGQPPMIGAPMGQPPAGVAPAPAPGPAPGPQPVPGMGASDPASAWPPGLERIYDLALGKYDLTVETGPSFTTRREEAANQMIELIRANPAIAPMIGDLLAKNLDWPGADEVARRLQAMLPPQVSGQGGADPQSHAMIEMGMQKIQGLTQELAGAQQRIQAMEADQQVAQRKLDIDEFKAQTDRMKAENDNILQRGRMQFGLPPGPNA